MKRKKPNHAFAKMQAFTLVEVMVAFVISIFIMAMIMRSYHGITSSLNRVRERITIVNRASLLLHQLEKDLSSLFIPFLHKKIEPESKDIQNKNTKEEGPSLKESEKDENKSEKRKQKEEDERRRNALIFSTYEDEDQKVDGERWKLFKSLTAITTQPLVVYGQRDVRLVRIMYKLEPDKQNSTTEKKAYTLIRKQTVDLENYKMKPHDETGLPSTDKQQNNSIKEEIVASGIKEMFIQITTEKKEQEPKGKHKKREQKERELISLFEWGDTAEYGGNVPIMLLARVSFWNDAQTDDIIFENAFPVYSYPTENYIPVTDKKEEPKQDEDNEKQINNDEKKDQPQPKVRDETS